MGGSRNGSAESAASEIVPETLSFWSFQRGLLGGYEPHGASFRSVVAVTRNAGRTWRVVYRGKPRTIIDSVAAEGTGKAWATARPCVA